MSSYSYDRVAPSINSAERQALTSIDADTTDYYDGPEGLPPPHRLSSRFSGSPFPEPRSSFDQPLQRPSASTNAYSDPFAAAPSTSNTGHEPQRDSMSFYHDQNHNGHSAGVAPGQIYPPSTSHGSFNPNPAAPPHTLYDNPRAGSIDDYSYRNENDTWAAHADEYKSASSTSLARDRYMQRKEAQAAAAGGLLGGGSKEGAYGYSYANANAAGKTGRRRRWWWWIAGGVVLLAIVGIVVGVVVSRKSSSSSSGSSISGVVKVNGNDPSNFDKDSRLHNSFYGMCYTPLNAQYPACGANLADVITDIQLMSQLTTRLRLYGADCNVTELVLEAITQTKVNMTIYPAIWINDDDTIYNRGASEVITAIQKYGTDKIDGITVGNEYLLNGGSVTNLVAKMADFRTKLQALSLSKTIPVGTGDAGGQITLALAEGADYVMANNHPYFAGVTINDAAGWTWEYTNTNTPSVALQASNKPTLYIAEVGWPSGANDTQELTYEGAVAGMSQLQTFLDTYVCAANANGTTALSFYFEYSDEKWKDLEYGGVEGYWGLFYGNRTLKPVTIPDCAHL